MTKPPLPESTPPGRLKRLWKRLPEPVRHSAWTTLGPRVQSAYATYQLARGISTCPKVGDVPLVVAGLFSTANGIGEAARATWRALDAAGLSPIAVDLSEHLAPIDMDCTIPCQDIPDSQDGILILQLNGPETMAAIHHLGLRRGRRWYIVGYWAWELPSFPPGWNRAFAFLSEIWAISSFTAAALRQHRDAPDINIFPHAISAPGTIAEDRAQFGWPPAAFTFLTMADSMSSLQRKNPFAAIDAFKQAFGDSHDHQLIVKTRNLVRDPVAEADLMTAIGDARNIHHLDASLSDTKRWELLAAADAIISLHRSEGFGFVIAEAMAIGKPVVTTDWSGNMDFTDPETTYLVRSELVACEDCYGVYSDTSARWAEVDIEHACETLREVANDPDGRTRRAAAAQTKMRSWADVSRIGAQMAEHLSRLRDDA